MYENRIDSWLCNIFLRVKNKIIYDVRYDDMLGVLMKRHRKVSKPAISIL